MGNQLLGRPVSQRTSFPTLTGASSPFSPNLGQSLGTQAVQPLPGSLSMPAPMPTLGGGQGGFQFDPSHPLMQNIMQAIMRGQRPGQPNMPAPPNNLGFGGGFGGMPRYGPMP